MKPLTPLSAGLLSFLATNSFWVGKDFLWKQHQQPIPEEAAREAQDTAGQGATSGGEGADAAAAASQLLQLSEDVAVFAFESSVGLVLPVAAGPSGGGSRGLGAALLGQLLDAASSSTSAVGGTLGALCPPTVNAADMCEVAATYGRGMVETVRQGFASWLQGFVERFPQYRKALLDRDPLLVMLVGPVLVALVVVDLYITTRCLLCLLCSLWAAASRCCLQLCCGGEGGAAAAARSGSSGAAQASLDKWLEEEVAAQPKRGKKGKKGAAEAPAAATPGGAAEGAAEAPPSVPVSPTAAGEAEEAPPSEPVSPTSPSGPESPTEGGAKEKRKRKKASKERVAEAAETVEEAETSTKDVEEPREKKNIGKNAYGALLNSDSE